PVDFDRGDVDLAPRVTALTPGALAILVEPHGQRGRSGEVHRVGMKLDFDPVGVMLVRGIVEDMTARHEEQPGATFEEEAAGTCEQTVAIERCDARGREQEGFGHRKLQGCAIVRRMHRPRGMACSEFCWPNNVVRTSGGASSITR